MCKSQFPQSFCGVDSSMLAQYSAVISAWNAKENIESIYPAEYTMVKHKLTVVMEE
jgi:hypothetical protein